MYRAMPCTGPATVHRPMAEVAFGARMKPFHPCAWALAAGRFGEVYRVEARRGGLGLVALPLALLFRLAAAPMSSKRS